jgi:hypothetical protein
MALSFVYEWFNLDSTVFREPRLVEDNHSLLYLSADLGAEDYSL